MKTRVQLSTAALTALLVIGLLAPLLGQPCGEVPPGAVAWWRAEFNAQDSAGAHHATLRQGAVVANGRVGQAFRLDGTDDNLEVPDSPGLNFGTGDFTASCWVNFKSTDESAGYYRSPARAGAPAPRAFPGWRRRRIPTVGPNVVEVLSGT